MADWIKVRHALVRSAKVRQLARALGVSKHEALGVAVCWLVWVDEQLSDCVTGLHWRDIDDELGVTGLADGLRGIGWISVREDGVVLVVDFDQHCGSSAKRRCEDATRQAVHRARKSRSARDMCHEKCVTNVTGVSRAGADGCHGDCESLGVDSRFQVVEEADFTRNSANNTKCHGESVTDVTDQALPDKIREEYINGIYTCGSKTVVCTDAAARPAGVEEVRDYMKALPNVAMVPEQVELCAEVFFNESEAVGWLVRGVPVRDWKATARAFLGRWQVNVHSGGVRGAVGRPVRFRSQEKKDYDL